MRVAMISMHTSPVAQPGAGDAGGMNVYVLSSARELARRGVAVDVFTRATRPSQGEVIELSENLRVINIVAGPFEGLTKEELPTQLAAFAGGIVMFARYNDLSYDVVHSHYWLSGQVGWLLRDLWEVPLVHTAHTLAAVKNAHRSAGDAAESNARRICEQQLVDNADRLVVNTAEEVGDLRHHYDADPGVIDIVAPGADVETFSPGSGRSTERARRELGVPLNARAVAFVGRMQQFKGPQVLIRAVARIAAERPELPVVALICGGASGAAATASWCQDLAAELGVSSRVRFFEPRPPEELAEVYRAADVVAVPSYNESFGLVALEAQATGTPVVAARVGGLPTAVADGESGVLVDGHDPEDWAAAIGGLLAADSTRAAMGRRARAHAKRFSWAATAAGLEETYRRVLDRRRPSFTDRRASGSAGA